MAKLSVCLIFLQVLVLALAEADKKSAESQAAQVNDSADEDVDAMEGLGWCKDDQGLAALCIACAQLPGGLAAAPGECCTDADVLEGCKNCIDDPERCLKDELNVIEGGEEGAEADDTLPPPSKRYGMLLFGRGIFNPSSNEDKRYGTLSLGKRYNTDDDPEKRWGTLGMRKRYGTLNLGSYFAKRYGMLNLGYLGRGYGNVRMGKRYGTFNLGQSTFGDPDKRWGTLNMNKKDDALPEDDKRYGTLGLAKRYGSLGLAKRFGTLHLGKRYGTLGLKRFGTLNIGKRYGTLNLGKRYGTLNMNPGYGRVPLGKRYGTLSLGKRFGTLNMGGSYGYYPYKRNEYVPYNGNIGTDMKKRYGRLFMGQSSGKRSSSVDNSENDIKKR